MPVPDVPWAGRDTAALSHERIHRWVHDGADPAALDSARARHAARGEELRAAAERLERAHTELGASWRGRDADAASTHIRSLVARMSRLGDAVAGQAGSLQGVRDALARVQSAVGPPRPPALPVLGAAPRGLPSALAAGGPADGFGAFQAAQVEERAAQNAYRAYLDQTGLAARSAPSAADGRPVPGGAVEPPPVRAGNAGSVPGPSATSVRSSAGPSAGPPARSGVLARAAGVAAGPAAPSGARAPAPLGGSPIGAAGGRGSPTGRPGAGPPARPASGSAAGPASARPGPVGRIVSRLLGGPSVPSPPGDGGTGRGPRGALPDGVRAPGPATGPATGTAADRLLGASTPPPRGPRVDGEDARSRGPRGERAPGPDATARADATGGNDADPPAGPALGGAGPPPLPPTTGVSAEAHRPVHRHPEYLVDADPWAEHADDPAQRRLVTPPVLGEDGR